MSVDPRVTVKPVPYRHYTQGVFHDIPTRPVYAMDEMDQDDIYEAYAQTLDLVGGALKANPIKDLAGLTEKKRNSILLGAELVQLCHNVSGLAKESGRTPVLNLVQGMRPRGVSTVSPHPVRVENYVVGNLEFYEDVDAGFLVSQAAEWIPTLMVDSDYKSGFSPEFLSQVQANAQASQILLYSDLDAWTRTVAQLVMHLSAGDHRETRVCILPENQLSGRLHAMLERFGYHSFVRQCAPAGAEPACDILASFALTPKQRPGAEVLQCLREGGTLIDGGVGSLKQEVYDAAHESGVMIYRPDMRAMIASEIHLGLSFRNFADGSVGRKVIEGIEFVSGGVVGRPGAVVVDSVHTPKKVLGFADGRGTFTPFSDMGSKDMGRLMQAWRIIQEHAA